MAVNVWIECLHLSYNLEYILALGNNTLAIRWLLSSGEMPTDSIAIKESASGGSESSLSHPWDRAETQFHLEWTPSSCFVAIVLPSSLAWILDLKEACPKDRFVEA
jgi:hypothetical protein